MYSLVKYLSPDFYILLTQYFVLAKCKKLNITLDPCLIGALHYKGSLGSMSL